MNEFKQHTGIVIPLDIANIDTDQIIPKQFLSKITRDGFGQHLFHDWRYLDESGSQDNLDFNLNKPQYKGGSILLTRENFGCGSSREHAPWALIDYGFKAIIASSFADIFHSNAINNGLLPVILTTTEIDELFELVGEGVTLTVDLKALQVITSNQTIYSFTMNPFQQECLVKGLDSIGWTLQHLEQIKSYEKSIPKWRQ